MRGKVTVREFHSDMILEASHSKASLPLEKEQKNGEGGGGDCGMDSGKRAGGHGNGKGRRREGNTGRSKTDERALSISN